MGYKTMNIDTYGYVQATINTHYSNASHKKPSRFHRAKRSHQSRANTMTTNNKATDTQQAKLDEVVTALEQEGVSLENYQEKKEGLGDVIGNIFTKLGVTEETVEKWSGIGGCGCQKRKKFLNKIIPFRKKA